MPNHDTLSIAKVMDLLLDAVCVVDAEGRFVFVSAGFERVFGYAPDEIIGTPMIDLVLFEDRERTLQAAGEIMDGSPKQHFQNRYVRKDGRIIDVMWSARWSPEDRLRIAVARDITAPRRAEAMQAALYAISEAAHTAEDLPALFRRIHRIIGGLLPAVNFFVALYDRKQDRLSFPYFVDQHDPAPPPQPLDSGSMTAKVIRSGQPLLLISTDPASLPDGMREDPSAAPLEWLGVPLRSQHGVVGALVVQSYSGDVHYSEQDQELLQYVSAQAAVAIERKQTQAWLQYVARHDPLTDLPNRQLFQDRLQTGLARARRDHERIAVLYIDLDQFKPVNDRHGHAVGDQLLRGIADRIRECVPASDTIARIGGDEFVVLLHDIHLPADAVLVAAKIGAAIEKPFELAGAHVQVSSSIGIAMYPDHGEEDGKLLREADGAMYDAKRHGGNGWHLAPQVAGDTAATSKAKAPSAAG